MSHVQILSVSSACVIPRIDLYPTPCLAKDSLYCSSTKSLVGGSPSSRSMVMFRTKIDMSPPGKTPRVSFLAVVTSTGTLLQRPCATRSRGSAGTVSPSTTTCHPRWPGMLAAGMRCLLLTNLASCKALWMKLGEPMSRERSSETQSPAQSFCARILLRQRTVFSGLLRLHPDSWTTNSVRSSFVLRSHMSAGGETMTALWNSPAEPGATMWSRMLGQPKLMPTKTTRLGSPPKAAMFLLIQRRASCWSRRPRFLGMPELSGVPS
mmetsp:Transcript_39357/g.122706  ORF Transcript_39357/g.122706 Transcript_39357/m.122706 type:complete len:265 (+) Transcript_39357:491-1285(+)